MIHPTDRHVYITANFIEAPDMDIFQAPVDAIVNPVNVVGVSGAGLAKAVRDRYPSCFRDYQEQCRYGNFQIGQVLVYCIPEEERKDTFRFILSFPTKEHWKKPSQYDYIEQGLKALARCLNDLEIKSVAIPPLGCGLGGLEQSKVKKLIYRNFQMHIGKYLQTCYLVHFI